MRAGTGEVPAVNASGLSVLVHCQRPPVEYGIHTIPARYPSNPRHGVTALARTPIYTTTLAPIESDTHDNARFWP